LAQWKREQEAGVRKEFPGNFGGEGWSETGQPLAAPVEMTSPAIETAIAPPPAPETPLPEPEDITAEVVDEAVDLQKALDDAAAVAAEADEPDIEQKLKGLTSEFTTFKTRIEKTLNRLDEALDRNQRERAALEEKVQAELETIQPGFAPVENTPVTGESGTNE
jgi:hypothetical protein